MVMEQDGEAEEQSEYTMRPLLYGVMYDRLGREETMSMFNILTLSSLFFFVILVTTFPDLEASP